MSPLSMDIVCRSRIALMTLLFVLNSATAWHTFRRSSSVTSARGDGFSGSFFSSVIHDSFRHYERRGPIKSQDRSRVFFVVAEQRGQNEDVLRRVVGHDLGPHQTVEQILGCIIIHVATTPIREEQPHLDER